MLLFLHPSNKPNSGLDIDRLISAEIPNKETHPSLFLTVTSYMMHGPCGANNYKSPCMKEGKCTKKFPKGFCSRTIIDDDRFPHYKRRDNGRVAKKNGVELDNRFVVPYNAKLLLKYQAHINVEYTCQTSAIKYLFKYIYKGNDRVTAAIHHSDDEIKMFYDFKNGILEKKGFSIGRINRFSANSGEDSYLRVLLNFKKGCTSYEDLRTINGVMFPTFKNACYSLGLLDDDNEYIDAIKEASSWQSASYLRRLFALLLFGNSMNRPENVWGKCWQFHFDDVLYRHRTTVGHPDANLTEEQIKNTTLAEIDKVLQSNGKCLFDYPSMPCITGASLLDMHNLLVLDELLYDRLFLVEEHKRLMSSLTDEQKVVYDKIISAVSVGKTFIWNASIRSKGEIILNVASSGIASLLLPGGRTTHSRFRIPIQITEASTCNIRKDSNIAELLAKTKLIIWDEAPMVHGFFFKALDKTLRDVLRFSDSTCVDKSFGGKVVVLGGDFRQILPVAPHGSRLDIVHATINSSCLWSHCHLLTLTKNMRLSSGSDIHNLMEIKEFSDWLLKVRDGVLGDDVDGESIITIPDELLIKKSLNPLSDLMDFVYPDILDHILEPTFFKKRAILTPKLAYVSILNENLMSLIPGDERIYLSSDNILKQDGNSSLEDDDSHLRS
ncbi:uncharacterized protein LOC133297255 [Gastrolobium bilobum]|uniref:uncharacterized protein LOC133297255 n=1 Tax=Gastrolobium bilobum TaxID=150636 RepID=UPI002AB12581|nr:uncharacterized protein LOC133297255 [Gastrolobium bilobum]